MFMVLMLLLALGLAACGSEEARDRPNVILLVMDTTRADRCSVNGYEHPTTPALEALAREGINFRNSWSPAGWTGPAHASMFSGLLPERHGFRRKNREYLDRRTDTLAERLQQEGYRTACVTNNPTIGPDFGLDQGFESYYPLYLDENVGYPSAPATHRIAFDWAKRAHESTTCSVFTAPSATCRWSSGYRLNYRAVFDGRFHWIHGSDGSLQVFDVLLDPAEAAPLRGASSGSPRNQPLPHRTPETGLLHR
jgi:hypothetical protein